MGGRMTPLSRFRTLVNGSNMEVQRIANQEPLVKFSIVPIAGVNVLRIPARYQPLTRPQKMGVPPRLTTSSTTWSLNVAYRFEFGIIHVANFRMPLKDSQSPTALLVDAGAACGTPHTGRPVRSAPLNSTPFPQISRISARPAQ
jgi:hypothetical protein